MRLRKLKGQRLQLLSVQDLKSSYEKLQNKNIGSVQSIGSLQECKENFGEL